MGEWVEEARSKGALMDRSEVVDRSVCASNDDNSCPLPVWLVARVWRQDCREASFAAGPDGGSRFAAVWPMYLAGYSQGLQFSVVIGIYYSAAL